MTNPVLSGTLDPAAIGIPSGPGTAYVAAAPSDSTELPIFRGLWVGGSGDLAIRGLDGVDVVISGVIGGTFLPFAGRRVLATGTTATSIVVVR